VTTGTDEYPPELAVGVTSSRLAEVSAAARSMHKAVLRAFATQGRAPVPPHIAAAANRQHDVAGQLVELHDHDVIRLDGQRHIRAAYPFSAVPTPHLVAIDGGPTVHAMCAIDALGVADMLGRPVVITSTDPVSSEPIQVTAQNGCATWEPRTTVVFVGSYAKAEAVDDDAEPSGNASCTVAAVDRCCGVMNFFTSIATAQVWIGAHPEASGVVLNQDQAMRLAVDIFGHLLDD
jgi:hypothetical protein